jgi:WD40 repeat protein
VVAVALGSTVYLWDASSGSIQQLMDVGGEETDDQSDYVTSVSWAGDGKHLAVGLGSSEVQLWDCEAIRQVGKSFLKLSDFLLSSFLRGSFWSRLSKACLNQQDGAEGGGLFQADLS